MTTQLSDARTRLELATQRRISLENSLSSIVDEVRGLQGGGTTDAAQMVNTEIRLDAINTVRARLELELGHARVAERIDAENLESLEQSRILTMDGAAGCARTIALLEPSATRLLALSEELMQMRKQLPPQYRSHLQECAIQLGGCNVVGDYRRAVKSKADCENRLRSIGD